MPVPTRSGSQRKPNWSPHGPQTGDFAAPLSGTQPFYLSSFTLDGESCTSRYPASPQPGHLPVPALLTDEVSQRPGYEHIYRYHAPISDMEASLHGPRENAAHLKGLLAILGSRTDQTENHTRVETFSSPVVHSSVMFASSYIRTGSTLDHTHGAEMAYGWRNSVDYRNEQTFPSPECCTACADVTREMPCDLVGPESPNGKLAIAFTTDPEVFAPLCEPFAFWIADYVWKVVTTGMSLAPECSGPALTTQDPQSLLPLLAESISSLLLSTLLQPSAIFLSLHYISRLPAYIGPCALDADPESPKSQFRKALASADATSHECPITRTLYASFKLFVIGAILSNKVLDDHVFTLKTWHEISGLPLDTLNRLEWLGLDILNHELHVHTVGWNRWLHTLRSYHLSFASHGSIPENSSNLVYKILKGLTSAQASLQSTHISNASPVFLGIEDRKKVKILEISQTGHVDAGDFDMDEDGPLREEYIPRRASRARDERCHSVSKWKSPVPGEVSRWVANSVHPTVHWPITPLDALPQTAWPIPTSGGMASQELDTYDRTVQYNTKDQLHGGVDPAKPATLRDYFLTCSRAQGNLSSTWIPQLA